MIERASGVILAGGESRRLGYDKAMLLVDGQPLLSYVEHQLSLCFDEVMISCRTPRALLPHQEVLDLPQVPGPLGGLLAGLGQAKAEWVFVTACDMPFVSASYINWLACQRDADIDVVIACVHDRLQPMAAFYRRSVYAHFHWAALQGQFSLMKTLQQLRLLVVEDKDLARQKLLDDVFFDIDTPDDLARAKQLFAQQGKKLTMAI